MYQEQPTIATGDGLVQNLRESIERELALHHGYLWVRDPTRQGPS